MELSCDKCDATFRNYQNLQKHLDRKISCDKKLKCIRCNKLFKRVRELTKHENRKTPCDPIIGNPIEHIPVNGCRFCGRQLSSKAALNKHYNTCNIKNGGMGILFKTIRTMSKKADEQHKLIKALLTTSDKVIDYSNHHNTNISVILNNYRDDKFDEYARQILSVSAPAIVYAPIQSDVSKTDQINNRIMGFVQCVHRNPEYRGLQGIYVTDTSVDSDNSYIYDDDKWYIRDWSLLSKEILQRVYNIITDNKFVDKKKDTLNIMEHLFVLGGCGQSDVDRLTNAQKIKLYKQIGKQLRFETINID